MERQSGMARLCTGLLLALALGVATTTTGTTPSPTTSGGCPIGSFSCDVVGAEGQTVKSCCTPSASAASAEPAVWASSGNLMLSTEADKSVCFVQGGSVAKCIEDLATVAAVKDEVRDAIGAGGINVAARLDTLEGTGSGAGLSIDDRITAAVDPIKRNLSTVDAQIMAAVDPIKRNLTGVEAQSGDNRLSVLTLFDRQQQIIQELQALNLSHLVQGDSLGVVSDRLANLTDPSGVVEQIAVEARLARSNEAQLRARVQNHEDCFDKGLLYVLGKGCIRPPPIDVANVSCDASTRGQVGFDSVENTLNFCDGKAWTSVQQATLGKTRSLPGRDCLDILTNAPGSADGLYWIKPLDSKPAYQAYCDMTTDGGGFTMCYSTSGTINIDLEKTFTSSKPFGTNGYRSDCSDLEFNNVIYKRHTSSGSVDSQALFKLREPGKVIKMSATNYQQSGQALGSWDGSMAASKSGVVYQMGICGSANTLKNGLWFSSVSNSGGQACWKACSSWCSDSSATYFRAHSSSSSYSGVAFAENGHQPLGSKLISVGVRRGAAPASTLGMSASTPGKDCYDIFTKVANAKSGPYWIRPTGVAQAYLIECKMDGTTPEGGGWSYCYTSDHIVHIRTEVQYNYPYPTDGYRADCRSIEFNEVLYRLEDNGQQAWFRQEQGRVFKASATNYFTTGAAFGLWLPRGVAPTNYRYQLGICDHGSTLAPGIWMSGFTNCYKACNSWCGDTSSPYYRMDSEVVGSYDGVAFNSNGHRVVSAKVMSVAVRMKP